MRITPLATAEKGQVDLENPCILSRFARRSLTAMRQPKARCPKRDLCAVAGNMRMKSCADTYHQSCCKSPREKPHEVLKNFRTGAKKTAEPWLPDPLCKLAAVALWERAPKSGSLRSEPVSLLLCVMGPTCA